MTNSNESVLFIFAGVFSLAGVGVFIYGLKTMFKYSLIENIPHSKIRSMAMGLVEIQGNAVGDKYVVTPFSQSQCVYYRYKIEEYRMHESRDAKGNTQISYSWETISSGEQRVPFFGKDETGQVYIDPHGAEFNVSAKKVFLQRAGLLGGLGNILNDLKGWDNNQATSLNVSAWGLTALDPTNHLSFGGSVGDRKYYEYYIEPEEALFVVGTADNDSRVPNNVLIKKGVNEPTFIISNKSERELLGSLMWQMIACFVFGGAFFIGGIFWLLKLSRII